MPGLAVSPPHLAESSQVDRPLAVYFAACFKRREELRGYAAELEAEGVLVTSRWLAGSSKLQGHELQSGDRGAQLAYMDLEDVRAADLCLGFTEYPDALDPGRGGRHTELGIALGLGRPVAIVGPVEQVFHRLPGVVRHSSWGAARTWVLKLAAPVQNAA